VAWRISMKEKEKDIRTNIILPESMWVKLKIRAVAERVPFTEIVRRALREYLGKKETKKGKK
jgi:predicted DNA binding CopG/RHH family protein